MDRTAPTRPHENDSLRLPTVPQAPLGGGTKKSPRSATATSSPGHQARNQKKPHLIRTAVVFDSRGIHKIQDVIRCSLVDFQGAWPFQLCGWIWMARDCVVLRRIPGIRMHRAGCWLWLWFWMADRAQRRRFVRHGSPDAARLGASVQCSGPGRTIEPHTTGLEAPAHAGTGSGNCTAGARWTEFV
jgi:hypothetical protein